MLTAMATVVQNVRDIILESSSKSPRFFTGSAEAVALTKSAESSPPRPPPPWKALVPNPSGALRSSLSLKYRKELGALGFRV